jgi:hypothetical protein
LNSLALWIAILVVPTLVVIGPINPGIISPAWSFTYILSEPSYHFLVFGNLTLLFSGMIYS